MWELLELQLRGSGRKIPVVGSIYGVDGTRYWRTRAKAEVDFVIEEGGIIPIEVKSHMDPRRVERSLRSFIGSYEPGRAYVVGLRGMSGETEIGTCKVVFTDLPGLWELLKGTDLSGLRCSPK